MKIHRLGICPTLVTRRKNIFPYFFTELLTYHLSYSIYKHDAIDIVDPIAVYICRHVSYELRSEEPVGLRFDSTLRLEIVALFYARDKTKNVFLYSVIFPKWYSLIFQAVRPMR